jgi:isopropylmalate/homocitrate/citramalate synthase
MGYTVPPSQPLIGENAFATKAGIHIDGLLKNPAVYLPFDPQAVLGVPVKVAITPHSGRAGVAYWIATHLAVDCVELKSDPRVGAIYEEILKMFEGGRKEPLTDEEMAALVSKHMPELAGRLKGVGNDNG